MSVTRSRLNVLRVMCLGFAGLAGMSGLTGCHSEGGGFWSDDRYTFISRPWEPKTITLMDTRTGEALWSVDIPVGQQLVVGFSKGTGPNEYKPDEVVWEMMDAGRKYGTRDNRMPCPGRDSRRLDMTLRPTPEMHGTPVPGSPFNRDATSTTTPAGYTPPVRGPYMGSGSTNEPPRAIDVPTPVEPASAPTPAPEEIPEDMLPPK